MWIVRLALRRPYTFVVLALLLFFLGPVVIERTPVDIFPNIDIPVVSVIWGYAGLSPQQLSDRITVQFERSLTTTVNDIEHTESQTLNGIAVIKVYFHPNVNISQAVAQVTAIAQTALRAYPPGTTPPLIIQYSASSVPVLQLGLSGNGLTEQQLNDFGTNFIRTQLATVQGASMPNAYGGKQRQIQVDIDTQKLQAYGLSAADVVNAVSAQNIILPAGDVKMGHVDYQIETNSAPESIAALNDLPIKTVNGATIYVHDVGNVRDGFPPQTNIVRVDGQRASLMTILKTGNASTLDIISNVRAQLPLIAAQLPPALQIRPIADQSVFVKSAISGVVARGHHRRLSDRDHDPDLSRKLAFDPHHRGVDSAVHRRLAADARGAGRDHQHHDPGRTGAGRRHPGGRCHGRPSKTSIAFWNWASRSSRPSSTAPRRLPCPPSSPPSPSASSLCPCSSSAESRAISLFHWPRRSSSPCLRPTSSRGPSCRPWPSIC